ncbi:MAG: YcfA-like protein [Methanocella sp. PtaU1.Bin125]|nr:MAG: YcfA-like protein [Methanocella sp. PtaU1.Bin125]
MLVKLGYYLKRYGKGDHMIFEIMNPRKGYGIVSVPRHKEIDPGTLKDIIQIVSDHTGMTEEELEKMLR